MNDFSFHPVEQLESWHILIVDDDEEDFIITREMLKEAQGRRVQLSWASSFEAGLTELQARRYHAVLVDYDLGLRSGIELIRTASERGYPAPLILYTGRGSYDVDVEAMQAGATMYLTKSEANPLLLERSIRYAIERRQAEQALLERDQRLHIALDAAELGTWTYHFADHMLELDARAQAMYRAGEPRVNHDRLAETFIHPDDRPAMWAAMRRAMDPRGDGRYTAEYRILQPDGSACWLNAWGRTEFQRQGSERVPVRMVGASRDTSWEKQARQKLEQSLAEAEAGRSTLEAIMEYVPEGVTIADAPDASIRMVSRYGRELLGAGHEHQTAEQVAARWQVFDSSGQTPLPPEELPILRAIRAGEVVKEQELVQINERGQRLNLSCSAGPIRDSTGRITGGIVTWREVSERRMVEQALRESESRFRVALSAALISVYTTGADLRITWMHDPHINFNPATVLGLRLDQVVPGEVGRRLVEIQQAVIDTGRPTQGEIDTWVQGQLLSYAYYIELLRGAGGEVEGLACAGYDITRLKLAERHTQRYAAELERSNEALQQFALLASRDLQEPLRKLLAFGGSLQARLAGCLDEEAAADLASIQAGAQRMTVMIDGLLELSQVAGQAEAFAEIDLTRLAQAVVAELEPRIRAAGGQVTVEPLPAVVADEPQLRRLLQQMIGNAIQFHREGVPPVVRISGRLDERAQPPSVSIRIDDNGVGFAREAAGDLFLPFRRLGEQPEAEGTGLGLAICQRIVERHHGTIEVESEPGKGTTFLIRLPASGP